MEKREVLLQLKRARRKRKRKAQPQLTILDLALAAAFLTCFVDLPDIIGAIEPLNEVLFADLGYVALSGQSATIRGILKSGDTYRNALHFLEYIKQRESGFLTPVATAIKRLEVSIANFEDLHYFMGFDTSDWHRTSNGTVTSTLRRPHSVTRELQRESETYEMLPSDPMPGRKKRGAAGILGPILGFGTRIFAPVARAGAAVVGKAAPKMTSLAASASSAASKAGAAVGNVGGKLATTIKANWKTIAAHTALNGAALAGSYYLTKSFNNKISEIEENLTTTQERMDSDSDYLSQVNAKYIERLEDYVSINEIEDTVTLFENSFNELGTIAYAAYQGKIHPRMIRGKATKEGLERVAEMATSNGMLSLVTEPSELIRVADVTIRVEAFTGNMHVEMGVPLVEEKNIFRVQNFRGVSAPFDGEQRSISVDKEYLLIGRSHSNAYTAMTQNEFDKCKMASSRVRICEHAHFLYRDHGLAEDLEGDVDDARCLYALMKRRGEQAAHYCTIRRAATNKASVQWLYGGKFAIQNVQDRVATLKCPLEPVRQIPVRGNAQVEVPPGCSANLDDFVLFGPPAKFHAGDAGEIDSPGLSYNFSMVPDLLSAIEKQDMAVRGTEPRVIQMNKTKAAISEEVWNLKLIFGLVAAILAVTVSAAAMMAYPAFKFYRDTRRHQHLERKCDQLALADNNAEADELELKKTIQI